MITVTRDGRTAVGPTTDQAVTARYIAAHAYVPKGIEAWSAEQIREVATRVDRDKLGSWERALITIAHHQSRLGCDLIKALWAEAPEELHGFCEQAYAEALLARIVRECPRRRACSADERRAHELMQGELD